MRAIAALQMRQMFGGKKLLILGGLLAIPLGLTLLIATSNKVGAAPSDDAAISYLLFLFPQAICLLLGVFHGTSILGSELEGKTLTYLFSRPMPRWKVLLGKYVATVGALVVPVVAAVIACWVMMGSKGGAPLIAGCVISTAAALFVYTAVFAFIGTIFPRRAMVAGLLLGLVYEFPLAYLANSFGGFTAIRHLRVLAIGIADKGTPRHLVPLVGDETTTLAIAALFGITAGALALASWVVTSKEYVLAEEG